MEGIILFVHPPTCSAQNVTKPYFRSTDLRSSPTIWKWRCMLPTKSSGYLRVPRFDGDGQGGHGGGWKGS